MSANPTLHFFCGKAGAGKSTKAKELAERQGAILLSEDIWLSRLYGDRIQVFQDYVHYSQTLATVIEPLVIDLLRAGQTVVMDYQGNTKRRRRWFRSMFERSGAAHRLHWIRTPDELCLARIARRNVERPEGSSELSEEGYWHVASYFEPPEESEGFEVESHAS